MHNPTTRTPTAAHDRARTRPRVAASLAVGLGTAALVLVAPAAASAHVHVTPTSTEAGATSELDFSFSHGCDGSPTTAVEVTIPDEVGSVALIANAGWDVASGLQDGTRVVSFTADKPTPDGVRETLALEVTLPEDAADGTVLAFPTLQMCETGETLWGDADPEADTPAPSITIGEDAAHGHGAAADHDAEAGDGSAEQTEPAAESPAPSDEQPAPTAESQAPAAESSAATPLAVSALVIAVLAAALAAFAAFRRRA